MNYLESARRLFGIMPPLPPAPKPPADARRIYLRGDRLIWRTIDDVRKALGDNATYLGKTVNLRGAVLHGKNLPRKKDDQDERAMAIQIQMPDIDFINGWVVDVPGGIVVKRRGCSFRNLTFVEIGEDALSTVGEEATDINVSRCEFWNAGGDKAVQLNQANGAALHRVRIVGGITGVRIMESSYRTRNVKCLLDDCAWEGCDTAINAGGGAEVRVISPTFWRVRLNYKLSAGAEIKAK